MKNIAKNSRGSLALEQVLFIAAIIALSAGIYAFYNDISAYFSNFDLGGLQTTIPSPNGSTPSN